MDAVEAPRAHSRAYAPFAGPGGTVGVIALVDYDEETAARLVERLPALVTFGSIVGTLIRPGLGFLGIFTFIASWNDYLWPLVVLNDPNRITLQVAMAQLNRTYGFEYGLVMAGALITTLPLIIVFLLGARQFIGDIARGAVK